MLGLGLGLSKTTNIVQSAGGNAFTADILDSVSTTPRIAYSLVRLKSTQTNCIQVRRASDNATQNIGFCNGIVDANAIATFCGASNGFVSIWYDQSGSNYDISAASGIQPKIYDGTTGMLKDSNGNYAVKGDSATSAVLTRTDGTVPDILANSDAFAVTVYDAAAADLSSNKPIFCDTHTNRYSIALYSTVVGSFTGNAMGCLIRFSAANNNLGVNLSSSPVGRCLVYSQSFLSNASGDVDIYEDTTQRTVIDGGAFGGSASSSTISLFGDDSGGPFIDGYISTFMDFNQTVSASDKNTLRSYFTAQFVTAGEVNNTTYPQSC